MRTKFIILIGPREIKSLHATRKQVQPRRWGAEREHKDLLALLGVWLEYSRKGRGFYWCI